MLVLVMFVHYAHLHVQHVRTQQQHAQVVLPQAQILIIILVTIHAWEVVHLDTMLTVIRYVNLVIHHVPHALHLLIFAHPA